jgi:hypothetical protein
MGETFMTQPLGHEKLIAYKATIQAASLVDLATANGVAGTSRVEDGRDLLRRMAAMLTALLKFTAHDS